MTEYSAASIHSQYLKDLLKEDVSEVKVTVVEVVYLKIVPVLSRDVQDIGRFFYVY